MIRFSPAKIIHGYVKLRHRLKNDIRFSPRGKRGILGNVGTHCMRPNIFRWKRGISEKGLNQSSNPLAQEVVVAGGSFVVVGELCGQHPDDGHALLSL